MPCCAASSIPARGRPGPSRCAAASRRRWPKAAAEHGRALAQEQVLQFAFSRQWNDLREAAARSAIRILGDVAIFVNMDSADVWVHPEFFELDEDLKPVAHRRRAARLLFAHRAALGQSALSLGGAGGARLRLVDRTHSPRGARFTTLSAWTTSAASRPIGPIPADEETAVERRVGEGAGAQALSRAGGGAGAAAAGGRGPGRDYPRR